jgi:hypothetical protein
MGHTLVGMTDSEPMGSTVTVLKRDAVGRVQRTLAQREAILDEFERSGLSGKAFARVAGIKYQTFVSWRQDRRESRGLVRKRTPGGVLVPQAGGHQRSLRLVEARMDVAVPPVALPVVVPLEVRLPGGSQVDLKSAEQVTLLAELIKALAGSAPC